MHYRTQSIFREMKESILRKEIIFITNLFINYISITIYIWAFAKISVTEALLGYQLRIPFFVQN